MKNNLKSSKSKCKKQQQATTQTHDSGRSMVEMLGVLAVIGVLSIGGIMGYTYAMNKIHVNEILAGIQQRAFVASQQRMQRNEINLDEFGELKVAEYDLAFKNNYSDLEDAFSLTLLNVPEKVCNLLIQTPIAVEMLVDDTYVTSGVSCPADVADVTFAFANDLMVTEFGNDSTGDSEDSTPDDPEDSYVSVCDPGSFKQENNDMCYSCDTSKNTSIFIEPVTEDECNLCNKSEFKWGWTSGNKRCHTCEFPEVLSDFKDADLNIFRKACNLCGRGVDLTGYELLCAPGKEDVTECQNGEVKAKDGLCWSCDSYISRSRSDAKEVIQDICTQCGLGVDWVSNLGSYKCSSGTEDVTTCSTRYFMDTDNTCQTCSSSITNAKSEDECNKCNSTGNTSDKRAWVDGQCYRCSGYILRSESGAEQKIKEVCGKCGKGVDWTYSTGYKCSSGTEDVTTCSTRYFMDTDNACRSCSSSITNAKSEGECNKCNSTGNTSDKRAWVDGQCYRCSGTISRSESGAEQKIKEVCNKCGKGVDWMYSAGYRCASGTEDVTTCSTRYFMDTDNTCQACYDSGSKTNAKSEDECNKCNSTGNTSDKRAWIDGQCYRCGGTISRSESGAEQKIKEVCNKCGKGVDWVYSDGYRCASGTEDVTTCSSFMGYYSFVDTNNICRDCYDVHKNAISEAECNKCNLSNFANQKRAWVDGLCYRCEDYAISRSESGAEQKIQEVCAKCNLSVDWNRSSSYYYCLSY